MKFNISGFTHKGCGLYESNEDNILINGVQMNGGMLSIQEQYRCVCFVADGVGGSSAGDFASSWVLSKINESPEAELAEIVGQLNKINEDLIRVSSQSLTRKGCACTLSGMVITADYNEFIHVGDSEIWLLRNDMLLKISQDEVVDPDDPASPLTNYFGGDEYVLKIKSDWFSSELIAGDIYLICSDGLFKALNAKIVKAILASEKEIGAKVMKIKENCLGAVVEDNVSVIIIEVLNKHDNPS